MQNDFDVKSLNYADIRPHYGTFQSVHVSGSGRNKVSKTRVGVKTNLGDIEQSEWRDITVAVIKSKGDVAEFNNTLEWVKRQRKYNQLKTETEFLQNALERFLCEKASPEKWVEIRSRKRFASRTDFESTPTFQNLVWLNATVEVMEDGSEWVAVVTELGEIQKNLWLELSKRLISNGGYSQMLLDETVRLRESYCWLLENRRVDERFIELMSVQNIVRILAKT